MGARTISGKGLARRCSSVEWLILAGIAASLLVQTWLILVQEFNWDEFHFLGLVHDYQRGEVSSALQTFHVHLFQPLVLLSGGEISQLIAGRLAMLLLEAASLAMLYLLCRTWAGRGASLLALFAFAVIPATLQHGASFRADPLALTLSLAAMALCARARPSWTTAVALAVPLALAALVTIKVVFFAPALASIGWWRIARYDEPRAIIRWLAGALGLAALCFITLYMLHRFSLPAVADGSAQSMLKAAADKTLFDQPLFPRRSHLIPVAVKAPVQSLLILLGAVGLLVTIARRSGPERAAAIAMLGCIAPLLSVFFYRNAYPYFIPFITGSAFVAVAWLIDRRDWPTWLKLITAGAMSATGVAALLVTAPRNQDAQRKIIAAVHMIFPRPVAMIDRSHMIASFPKRGFLMSTWGLSNYRSGSPIFARILRRDQVPLLLVDSGTLEEAVGLEQSMPMDLGLLEKDKAVLRDNYLHHWGPVWVAGKRVEVDRQGADVTILVPGPHTVEGLPISLAGRIVAPGSTINLPRGTYRLRSQRPGTVILRWGDRLARPAGEPPSKPVFTGF